jgi:hypothetical protein
MADFNYSHFFISLLRETKTKEEKKAKEMKKKKTKYVITTTFCTYLHVKINIGQEDIATLRILKISLASCILDFKLSVIHQGFYTILLCALKQEVMPALAYAHSFFNYSALRNSHSVYDRGLA